MAKKKNKSIAFDQIKLFDPEEENLNFPSICRFIRETFKVTQEQMALKLKITPNGYANWEYARRVPKGFPAFNLRQLYNEAKKVVSGQELVKEPFVEFNQIKLFNPTEENLDFPSISKLIRDIFKITQEQIALKLEISAPSYALWESGKRVPKSWQAFNLRQLYDEAKELAVSQEVKKEQTPENTVQNSQPQAA